MNYNTFINLTILQFDSENLEALKSVLFEGYLYLSFLKSDDVSKEVLAEKLSDYFEKVEIKTGKSFEKHLDTYYSNIDFVVGSRVEGVPRVKKNEPASPVPRARKYYDKALQIKGQDDNICYLIDYTRLMMCLYTAIIKNNRNMISNMDYSADCIVPVDIINEIKKENNVLLGKQVSKKKFDISDCYSADACFMVITAILLYKIINDKIQEEHRYE